jgi:cytochrome P450 PksS
MIQETVRLDVFSGKFKADPFPLYARLRAESPVVRTLTPDNQPVWLITRYGDGVAVLKDERFVKSRANAMSSEQLAKQPWVPGFLKPMERNMLDLDGADHDRLKALVHKAFTPRFIEHMRERVQTVTDQLISNIEGRATVDLVAEFAFPLPMTIISDILGISQADHAKFRRWTSRIVSISSSRDGMLAMPTLWQFISYMRKLIKERRAHPGDDLISALVQAEDGGATLSEDELLGMIVILLIAGHETTVNLIANGTLELLRHPDQFALLRDDPSQIRTAVEELMRFTAPVEKATERYPREDLTIGGVTIPKGEMTLVCIASANRDAAQFPNPDALDITRAENKHLGFGQGVHYCLGAPLARMEAGIAFNTLLRRLPNLRLAAEPDKLVWRPNLVLRGMKALPVSV